MPTRHGRVTISTNHEPITSTPDSVIYIYEGEVLKMDGSQVSLPILGFSDGLSSSHVIVTDKNILQIVQELRTP